MKRGKQETKNAERRENQQDGKLQFNLLTYDTKNK